MISQIRRLFSRLKRIRFAREEGVRSSFAQFFHMSACFAFKKFTPLEYYLYGFYRRDKPIRGYVPNRWIEREFRPKLNPLPVAGLVKNKLLFYYFYSKRDLPVVEVYGLYHPEQGYTRDEAPLRTLSDLKSLLAKIKSPCLVAKPPCSLGGKGMVVLRRIAADRFRNLETDRELSLTGFYELMEDDIANRQPREDSCLGYLLQEYFPPHPDLNPLNGKPLNTVRIATLKDRKGEVHIDFAMLRVGKPTAVTDNMHKGGVVAGVDVHSGEISPVTFGYESDEGPWVEEKTQDIGALFSNRRIPRWKQIITTVTEFHRALEGVNSIGWDVALTDKGPVVIEGNDNWDMVIAQVIDGPYLTADRQKLLDSLGVNLP